MKFEGLELKQPLEEEMVEIEKDKEYAENNKSSGLDVRWNMLSDFISSKLERKKDNKETSGLDIKDLEKLNSRLNEFFDNLKIDQEILKKTNINTEKYKETVLDLYRIQTEFSDLAEEYGIESEKSLLNDIEKIYFEKESLLAQEEINVVLHGQELEVKGTLKDFLIEQKKHQTQGYSLISKSVRDRIEKATSELLKGTVEILKKVSPNEKVKKFIENIDTKKLSSRVAWGSSAVLLGGYGLLQVFNSESVLADEKDIQLEGLNNVENTKEEKDAENKELENLEQEWSLQNDLDIAKKIMEIKSEIHNKKVEDGRIINNNISTGDIQVMLEKKVEKMSSEPFDGSVEVKYNSTHGNIEIIKGDLILNIRNLKDFGENITTEKIDNNYFERFIDKTKTSLDSNEVSYKVEDDVMFNKLIEDEANRIIKELNLSGFSELKPKDWLILSAKIVQDNLSYDYEAKNANKYSKFNTKLDTMPMDILLFGNQKGLCRHYAALVEEVGNRIKELSGSKYLNNVFVDEIAGNVGFNGHAWNIIYEAEKYNENKVRVNMYFIDATFDDNTNEFGDKLDAYEKRSYYDSMEKFLLHRTKGEYSSMSSDDYASPENYLFSRQDLLDICHGIINTAENLSGENLYDVEMASRILSVYLKEKVKDKSDLTKEEVDKKNEIIKKIEKYDAIFDNDIFILEKRIEKTPNEDGIS